MATRADVKPVSKASHFHVTGNMQEMIGRYAPRPQLKPQYVRPSVDWTRVDYRFWSRFRRGKAAGYELGGLFGAPIAKIYSDWMLGLGLTVTSKPATVASVAMTGAEDAETVVNRALSEFVEEHAETLWSLSYDSKSLGDAYAVVNPDGSITEVPADQVEVMVNPLNFREIEGYKITSFVGENGGVRLEDEYRRDGRTVRINARTPREETIEFQNMVDGFPIVHFANEKENNEVYGHPVYEALLHLFMQYDDVVMKGLDGVKLMGNPIPVVEGSEDPEGEIERLSGGETQKVINADGNEELVPVIDFEQMFFLVLGRGAKFDFKSPGRFTGDTGQMLEYLFLLMLQHSRIPEWAWGGAIASSMASVEAQMPAFERTIDGLRRRFSEPLRALVRVWLQMRSLVDFELAQALMQIGYNVDINYPALTNEDATIKQNWIKFLHPAGLVTDETAVQTAGVVKDADAEVQKAREQALAQRDDFEARVNDELTALRSADDR